MDLWYMIFVAVCFLLFVVPLALVFNKDYDDRMLGRVGLLVTSFSAFIFLLQIFFGYGYRHLSREEVGILGGVALFLVWHAGRFCKRIAAERTAQGCALPWWHVLTRFLP